MYKESGGGRLKLDGVRLVGESFVILRINQELDLFGQALNCTCLSRASLAATTGETYEKKDSRYEKD